MKLILILVLLIIIMLVMFFLREYLIMIWEKHPSNIDDPSLPRPLDEVGILVTLTDDQKIYGENSIVFIPVGQTVKLKPGDLDSNRINILESGEFGVNVSWELTHCFKGNEQVAVFNCTTTYLKNKMEIIIDFDKSPCDQLSVVCHVHGPEGFIEKIAFCKIIYTPLLTIEG